MKQLLGKQVLHVQSKDRGTIIGVEPGFITVRFTDELPHRYKYPDAFADTLLIC